MGAEPGTVSPLYFRQLLAGRDFAGGDPTAAQMVNFAYLIGDRGTGECLVVDPAWDVQGLMDAAAADGMEVVGVLATHFHPDHVGGDFMGFSVQGIRELLERKAVPIHCHKDEAPWIARATGVSAAELAPHADGEDVRVGSVPVRLMHTPGHTPGSQCFLVEDRLVAGDTLFLKGCGRTDLPGGDPEQIYDSLTKRLARLPDDVVLYPGHLYDPRPSAPLGEVRRTNHVFQVRNLEDWLGLMGA